MSSRSISQLGFSCSRASSENRLESPFRSTPKNLQKATLGIFQELYRESFGISRMPQTFNEMCAFFEGNSSDFEVRELEDALKENIDKASNAVETGSVHDMKGEIDSMRFVSHSLNSQRFLDGNRGKNPQYSIVDVRSKSAGKSKSVFVESHCPMYGVAQSTYKLAQALTSLSPRERQEWSENLSGRVDHYQEAAGHPSMSLSSSYVSFSELEAVRHVELPRSRAIQIPEGVSVQRVLHIFNQLMVKLFPNREPVKNLGEAEEFLNGVSDGEVLDPEKVGQLRSELDSKLAKQQAIKLDQPKQEKKEEPESLNALPKTPQNMGLVQIFNSLLWEYFHGSVSRVNSEEDIDRFMEDPPEKIRSTKGFEYFSERFHEAVQKQLEKYSKLEKVEGLLDQIKSKKEKQAVSTYLKLFQKHFGIPIQGIDNRGDVKDHMREIFEDSYYSSQDLDKFHSELMQKLKRFN